MPWLIKEKICVISGATSGIGKAAANQLAKDGCHLVIIARNEDKVKDLISLLKLKTDNQNIDYVVADLSDLSQVRKAAEEIKKRYKKIDILINNAGAVFMKRELTKDGFEKTFVLNVLSPFLLTNLLLDTLKKSAPARIINVASAAHYRGKMQFSNINLENDFSGWKAYCQSKLAVVLFTHELAKRLENSGVTANALHPGFVASEFGKNNGSLSKIVMPVMQLLAISPEKGADTIIFLAESSIVENISGKYFDNKKITKSSDESYDDEEAGKLWKLAEQMTNFNTGSDEKKDK